MTNRLGPYWDDDGKKYHLGSWHYSLPPVESDNAGHKILPNKIESNKPAYNGASQEHLDYMNSIFSIPAMYSFPLKSSPEYVPSARELDEQFQMSTRLWQDMLRQPEEWLPALQKRNVPTAEELDAWFAK